MRAIRAVYFLDCAANFGEPIMPGQYITLSGSALQKLPTAMEAS
jgi:hypothetical protein